MNPNFSVMIQGPFDNKIWDKYRYTDHYLKYVDRVVISTYKDQDTKNVEDHIAGNDRVVLIKNKCPNFHCNPCNMYVHSFSTLKGAELVTTPYVIKIRANEFYTQIDKIIDSVLKYRNKFTVGNIHTMKTEYVSYQTSDHLFALKTDTLVTMMKQIMYWCEVDGRDKDKYCHLNVPELKNDGTNTERAFLFSFLKCKGYILPDIIHTGRDRVLEIMKDNVNIINVNGLKPIICSYNVHNNPTTYFDEWVDDRCANSNEEL